MAKEKHGYNMEQVPQAVTGGLLVVFLLVRLVFLPHLSPAPAGSGHVVMAQTRRGAFTGRPGQLHPLPR